MRALLRLGKDKSALSNVVAYVLLIAITISLSVLVYGWLRFYVSEDDVNECSSGVNIIVDSYECSLSKSDGTGGWISVTLKNKGLFTVDGYVLRVHDRLGAESGFYVFDENGTEIFPGEEYSETYAFADFVFGEKVLNEVTFIEVQPFIMEGEKISCKSYASQEVQCF